MDLVVTLIFIIAIAIVCIICQKKSEKRNLQGKSPPGPWGLPFVGFLIHFVIGGENYTKKLLRIKQKYGKIATVRMGSFKCIWLNDYKIIKEAWANPIFCGRPRVPGIQSRTHGFTGGIIFNDGEHFKEQRRFVIKHLKDFGFGRQSMESIILDEVVDLVSRLKTTQGIPISTRHCFNSASLNALWLITTGEKFKQDDPILCELSETLNRNLELNDGAKAGFFMPWAIKLCPSLLGWTSYVKDANFIFDFWKKYARLRMAQFKKDSIPSNFVDVYIQRILESEEPHSSFFKEIGEMSLATTLQDLFIAGTETTATTLSWALLLLAVFPNVQENFYSEIQSVVGSARLPSLSDRPQMLYTEALLQEVMRFATLTPLGVVHRATEDTVFHSYFIPKDSIIMANVSAVHTDPENWENPECFIPDRFLSPDKTRLIRHDAFLAFSFGKRLCIGENLARDELFLFLTTIFQTFIVTTDPGSPIPSLQPRVGVSAIPEPHKLILSPRL